MTPKVIESENRKIRKAESKKNPINSHYIKDSSTPQQFRLHSGTKNVYLEIHSLRIRLDMALKLGYTYQYIQIILNNMNNLDSGGDDDGEEE